MRAHLAGLLLDAGRPADALGHLELVLQARPDHREALALAARAARTLGDDSRAEAWQRLCDALGDQTAEVKGGAVEDPPDDDVRQPARAPASDAGDTSDTGDLSDLDAELQELVRQEAGHRVTLADVAGLEDVKGRLEVSFLGPMRNVRLRKAYGASLRGGLLLWGPPGCGKTFLARAVAGELGAHFTPVGLHDVLDMWLGNSEKHLHDLFQWARRHRPTVLFFDEVDAIGHSRADLGRSASRNVVAQLLAEMDGVDTDNEGVFIIGATNQPWDVDPALRRPGRLDRTMLVVPPDASAREAILLLHLRDRPYSGEPLNQIVSMTEGFSGADLKLVCDDATQSALAEAVKSGDVRPITAVELARAARDMHPSTEAWLEAARNFATYANTTGEYDELLAYLRARRQRR